MATNKSLSRQSHDGFQARIAAGHFKPGCGVGQFANLVFGDEVGWHWGFLRFGVSFKYRCREWTKDVGITGSP